MELLLSQFFLCMDPNEPPLRELSVFDFELDFDFDLFVLCRRSVLNNGRIVGTQAAMMTIFCSILTWN